MTDLYSSRVALQREFDSLFPAGALVTLLERSLSTGRLFPFSDQFLCARPFVTEIRLVEGSLEFLTVFDSAAAIEDLPTEEEPPLSIWAAAIEDANPDAEDGLVQLIEARPAGDNSASLGVERMVRLAVPVPAKEASPALRSALTALLMPVAFPDGLEVSDG